MAEKKTERIYLRLTSSEKKNIEEKAWSAKLNVSKYIVALSNDKPIIVIDDVAKLVAEIIRVGTNVNQIARVANSQKFLKREQLSAVEKELAEIKQGLIDLVQRVNRADDDDGKSDGLS